MSTSLLGNSIGSAIDTSGYTATVWQLSGVWQGAIRVEGSNDGTVWDALLVLPSDSQVLIDAISDNGIYSVSSSAKYVRYNAVINSGTAQLQVAGRTVDGIRAADTLSLAMDAANNTPLHVRLQGHPTDERGSLLPADCKGPFNFSGTSNNVVLGTLDTSGYNTVSVQGIGTFNATVTAYVSNDGVNWAICYGINATGGIGTLTGAGQLFNYPVLGKFFRLTTTAYTSGKADVVCYLRNAPFPAMLSSINTTISTVGGYSVLQEDAAYPAAASSPFPLPIGGVARTPTSAPVSIALNDSVRAGFTRQGALHTQEAAYSQSDVPEYLKVLSNQMGNMPALPVILTGRDHESNPNDILGQILTELKIMNQQLFDLPRILKSGIEAVDSPEQYRNDSTFFNS